jgi:hypothetical protein
LSCTIPAQSKSGLLGQMESKVSEIFLTRSG